MEQCDEVQTVIYKNAFMLPGIRLNRYTTSGGVYDDDGTLLEHCAIRTSPWITKAPHKANAQSNTPMLFGPSFFAGSCDKQFGFVLLNSLGRLWAIDGLPPETLIVYCEKPGFKSANRNHLFAVLRSLGISNTVIVTQDTLRFDTLHTAQELFGEASGATGHPAFYDWIDRKWLAQGVPDPDRKVYVTRSGLGPNAGRYACEDHLETLLQAEGYEIYQPEQHSISHQVQTFQAAGKLIFAEGSALHLFALIRQPGQLSAVIHRRETLPDVMLAQMADRSGTPTVAINAVSAVLWPPRRGSHLGISVLDFDLLKDRLQDIGLITGKSWRGLTKAQLDLSLSAGLAPGQELMTGEQRAGWLKEWRKAKGKR